MVRLRGNVQGQGTLMSAQLEVGPEEGFYEDVEGVSQAEFLDTPHRLQVIMEDERAGFLPKTHREKNQALAILDYIDNPDYPGGIHDYLGEIYAKHLNDRSQHNKAERARRDIPPEAKRFISRTAAAIHGRIAVQSVLYEFADYYVDAVNNYQAASILANSVEVTPNQGLPLGQALAEGGNADEIGLPQFIQFLDIGAMIKDIKLAAFDPLLTREQRHPSQEGKSKVVHSIFSGDAITHDAMIHIQAVRDLFKVGDLYSDAHANRELELNRIIFWGRVLSQRYYEYQRAANSARKFAERETGARLITER